MSSSAAAKKLLLLGQNSKLRHRRPDLWFGSQIVLICIFWWTASSGQSIVNKLALQHYPFPLTFALSSCMHNVIYAVPLGRLLRVSPVSVSPEYLLRTVVPISAGRAAAVASAYFALWKVSVSYAQTVKSTMPLFTVLISRFLLGEHQPARVYCSLLPIVIGVFIATATELQFDLLGLCSSLLSTGIFAFLNVLAKKVFEDTGMHPINLLSLNSQLASLMLFPFWMVTDAWKMWSQMGPPSSPSSPSSSSPPDLHFLFMLLLSGLCSFVQNLCAFALIHLLSTLSYSVTNTAKRVLVIALSLVTLRNPVTPLNVCGMMLSVFGVLYYNRTRRSSRDHPRPSPAPSSSSSAVSDSSDQCPQALTPLSSRRQPALSDQLQSQQLRASDSDVRLLLASE